MYCSDSCRSNKVRPGSLDEQFETTILRLLHERDPASGRLRNAFITCEAAEKVTLAEHGRADGTGEGDGAVRADGVGEGEGTTGESTAKKVPSKTRERSRQAARRLVARGKVLITQEGKEVDPSFAKGVMELRLVT